MERRRTASYTLRPVDVPPGQKKKPQTRVSELQRHVIAASETPGQWFLVAQYRNRTGAYQGKKRIQDKSWPWPVVVYAVAVDGPDDIQSELYVKVLDVREDKDG